MAIPKTMQAAVVEQFGKPLVMQEVPVPTPGPGQALVEIIATGVCHTDLHAANGDWDFAYWDAQKGIMSSRTQASYCGACHASGQAKDFVFFDESWRTH